VLNGNRVIAIRTRVRRGWSIKKIAHAFGVSRNTVRRYTRQGATPCGPPTRALLDVPQELDLVRRIARRWDIRDSDELESALIDKLAEIYPQKTVVAHWKAFLITALDRAAINWLRGRRRRERHLVPFDASREGEHEPSVGDIYPRIDVSIDNNTTRLKRMRHVLPPFLRRVWDALIAEDFDQTRAGQRLGMHRNMMRKAIRQIRIVLTQHGF